MELKEFIIGGVFLLIFGLIVTSIFINKKSIRKNSSKGSGSDYYQDDQEDENIKGQTE